MASLINTDDNARTDEQSEAIHTYPNRIFSEELFSISYIHTANIYRGVQGIYRDLCVQVFITGKTFDISRKSLLIWQGIPVKVRFPVDLTGNSCYIYS